MKTIKNLFIKFSLPIGLGLVLLGAYTKITHWKFADGLFITGFLALVVYTVNYYHTAKLQPMSVLRYLLIKVGFATGFCFSLLGAFFKISHWQGADIYFIIGLTAMLIFMAVTLYEVISSTRINKSEKIVWTIFIILLSSITGFFYILSGRKRIIPLSERQITNS
jgi:hypothetical protein